MSETVTKQSAMRIVFPNRKRHGLIASLFPKDYGQFLLVRFTGYLIAMIVVAFGFFVVTALLNDRYDKAVPLILLAAGVAQLSHDVLAWTHARIFQIEFKNATAGSTALAVIAAFTAIYFLGSKIPL
jgi:hypothetical protein